MRKRLILHLCLQTITWKILIKKTKDNSSSKNKQTSKKQDLEDLENVLAVPLQLSSLCDMKTL